MGLRWVLEPNGVRSFTGVGQGLRKHSSGDLHSRLKTRKILGVGETDNGDVHRSKISQLLGHNEHLYVKFPRGFWVWHLFMAALLTVQGFLSLFLPEKAFSSPLESQALFAARLHGAALLGISTFLWNFQGTTDKAQARSSLTAIMLYHSLQLAVCILSVDGSYFRQDVIISLGGQGLIFFINFLYHQSIGKGTSGLRKSSSFKDLTAATPSDKKESSPFREDKRDFKKEK